jgi:hypothetical protein
VLILEARQDQKYWDKLNKTIAHFGLRIDTWVFYEQGKMRLWATNEPFWQ